MGTSPSPAVFSSVNRSNDNGPPLTPQMQNLFPGPTGTNTPFSTPNSLSTSPQPGPGMPPLPAAPHSTPMRPRYPQQVLLYFSFYLHFLKSEISKKVFQHFKILLIINVNIITSISKVKFTESRVIKVELHCRMECWIYSINL